MPKFYITTPLYYVNDKPHIGHAYTTILADVLARYQKNNGNDVYFLTGTDEHGQKVQEAANKRGVNPLSHVNEFVNRFESLWRKLGIEYDDFIRTTESRHINRVRQIIAEINELGLNVVSRSSKKLKLKDIDIFIVDTFGETKKFYKFATTVFLGKSIIKGDYEEALEYLLNFSSRYDSEKNNEMRKLISERKSETEVIELLPYSMDIERNLLQQLSKDNDPKNAIRSIPLQLRRFYIQAYQSFLFNKTLSLANEFEENLFEPEIDDVCFDKNSVLGKFENIPEQKLAVPLVGHSYYKKSRFDYYIKKILEEELLTPKDFFIKDFQELSVEGGFRNASINYDNFSIDKDLVKFQLSRGSYATIVLREILKPANPLDCGF